MSVEALKTVAAGPGISPRPAHDPVRASSEGRPVRADPEASVAQHVPPLLEAVRGAAELINRTLQEARRDLVFSVDESTGRTVVQVISPGTGEVLRQIPSEEVLALAGHLREGAPLSSLGMDRRS